MPLAAPAHWRLAAAALWLWSALPAAAGSSTCLPDGWQLAAGAEQSRWQEHDAQGRRLLREQGTLATVSVAAVGRCAGLDWQATLAAAQGQRAYSGSSSTGMPIRTHSGIHRQVLHLQAMLPLAPTADGWSAGLRLGHRWLARDLAGVGAVQGYGERFASWQLAAGLARSLDLGPWAGAPLALDAALWLGGGPPGRMVLNLPHADAATLHLGASQLLQLRLGLCNGSVAQCRPDGGRPWRIDLTWQQERAGAGPAQALWRNGVLVGGAAQPATRQQALGLQATLGW